jgi:hypothetical protein
VFELKLYTGGRRAFNSSWIKEAIIVSPGGGSPDYVVIYVGDFDDPSLLTPIDLAYENYAQMSEDIKSNTIF